MKINEIVTEDKSHVPVVVAHNPAEAEKKFLQANKGKANADYDPRQALKKVRDRYEVEIIGDTSDCEGKHDKKKGDGKDSLLTNRKKKS